MKRKFTVIIEQDEASPFREGVKPEMQSDLIRIALLKYFGPIEVEVRPARTHKRKPSGPTTVGSIKRD